jgi:uncharacterized protein (TIRG00374 family)
VPQKLKRLVIGIVRLAVIAVLVAWVLHGTNLSDLADVAARLLGHWGLALAAVGVMMLQSPMGAVRWRLLLGVQGIELGFLESLRLTFIGWFFNNWMPGSTGGDFVKAYYVAHLTHRKPEAVTVVFLDRFVGLAALCLMGGGAVLVSLHDPRIQAARVIVLVFLAGIIGGGTVYYSRRLRRIFRVDWMLARLPLRHVVEKVDRALLAYRDHKGTVAVAVLYSWGTQLVSILATWWLASALGSHAAWYQYFIAMPAIWLVWALIPVPGGFGVAEAMVQGLFSAAVLSGDLGPGESPMAAADAAALALAMILALRVVQLLVSLPGVYFYLARRTDVTAAEMAKKIQEG